MMWHWIFRFYLVLVCPAGQRLSRAPSYPPRPRDRAEPAPHSSPPMNNNNGIDRINNRCHRRKKGRRKRTRRAGGGERRPPRDGLLGPRGRRKERGSPRIEGFPLFSGGINLSGFFFVSPFLDFQLRGRRLCFGNGTASSPPRFFFRSRF